MITLRRPSAKTGHCWFIAVTTEEDQLIRTVAQQTFPRNESQRAGEFLRELGLRFPSAYVAEF
jgi:hypothetical protein